MNGVLPLASLRVQKPCTDAYCTSRVVSRHTCEAPHRVSEITRAGLTAGLVQLAGCLPLDVACTHTAERKEDPVPAGKFLFLHRGSDAALDFAGREHPRVLSNL